MENASKALLIAASILIVIILIAFGMKTINSTAGTQESLETTMDATAKASFNNKFTSYVGNNKSASQAKGLANVVVSNNATDSNHQVSITITTDAPDSSSSATYSDSLDITNNCAALSGQCEISIGAMSADGFITNIIITKK